MRDDGCAACKSASSARARTLLALGARVRVGPHAEEAGTRGGACRQRRTPEEARAEKTGARKWGAARDRSCPHPHPHPHPQPHPRLQGKRRRVTAMHDRRGGACRQRRTREGARAEKTGTRREGAPRDRNCLHLHLHPHPHPEGLRRSVSATQDSRGGAGGEYGDLKAGRTAGQELPAPAPTPNPQGLRRRGWCRPHRRAMGQSGDGITRSRPSVARWSTTSRTADTTTSCRRLALPRGGGRDHRQLASEDVRSADARLATRHATSSRPTRATRRATRDARRAQASARRPARRPRRPAGAGRRTTPRRRTPR
ncbi:hypothetical protein EDF21_1166 [Frigoribacterium sp. PhB118]|nr:hypothetical protein EDF21_1166 [Frigoribacterium sp. PhB118]